MRNAVIDLSAFNFVTKISDLMGDAVCTYEQDSEVEKHIIKMKFHKKNGIESAAHSLVVCSDKIDFVKTLFDELIDYQTVQITSINEVLEALQQIIELNKVTSIKALFDYLSIKYGKRH